MIVGRIAALSLKEWREIVRDRLFFTLAFVAPTLQLLVFGYGLILDVEHIPFVVLDHDKSALSREYLHRFISSRFFDFKGEVPHEGAVEPLFADSKVRVALIIPPHFEEDLIAGRVVEVQSLIEGSFPFRTTTAKGYIALINEAFNGERREAFITQRMGRSVEGAAALVEPLHLHTRYLYNQELRSTWSVAAVMIMFVLMVSPPFLTAMGVVREKEHGSIYHIYSSPITKGEFLVGKLAPYVGISVINSVILWILTTSLFGAPFKGDPLCFFTSSVVYVTCTTGIGLLVSLMVRTQVAAMMITVVLTIVPAVLYSGLLIPVASMEFEGQLLAHLFPAMYFTDIALGSFLKGLGWKGLWGRMLALVVYAAVLWTTSLLLVRKRPPN